MEPDEIIEGQKLEKTKDETQGHYNVQKSGRRRSLRRS